MSNRTLARKLAGVKPGTLFVGVDLAADRSTAVVLTERAEQLDRFTFPTGRDGYDYLYHRVEECRCRVQAPAAVLGMEPTNYYWKLLAADIERFRPQLRYRLVNPYTVKKNREGDQLDRSKDDNRDAFTIADLLRTGKFTETRLLHGEYAELRQYVVEYSRLREEMRREKTLIRGMAGQVFPELAQVFRDLSGATALALLRCHAPAVVVRRLSQEALIADVRAEMRGRRMQVEKLCRVHWLAENSVGLTEGVRALQLALRLHIEALELLQTQLATLVAALRETFLAMPEAQYLLSVRGFGVITAAITLAEIGTPANYRNAYQLIKLAGTQPVPNTSGRKSTSRTPMSGKGRPRLRTALFFAVLRLVRLDRGFAQKYEYLQTRAKNPLTKMQALGVLMNRLLRIVWALLKNRTYYMPNLQGAA